MQDPYAYQKVWETPHGPLTIRPIVPGDEAELLRFFRDRLSAQSNHFICLYVDRTDDEALAVMREQIAAHARREALVFVACRQAEIVGYFFLSRLNAPDGAPPSLGISLADALHGCGIGSRFMDLLIESARALACRAIVLTHYPQNTRAAALYQRKGFRYTGETVTWQRSDGPRTEPRMILTLEPRPSE